MVSDGRRTTRMTDPGEHCRVPGRRPVAMRRAQSGSSRLRAGLCLLITFGLAGSIALAAAPGRASDDTAPASSQGRHVARQIFDAALLRPLQLVQVVASAAVFLPAYPVGLLVGEGDYVMETCIREPVDRAFRRPLGAL